MFMDDDNYAKPHELRTFVVAMENGNHTADLPRRTQLQVSCTLSFFYKRQSGLITSYVSKKIPKFD